MKQPSDAERDRKVRTHAWWLAALALAFFVAFIVAGIFRGQV